jgi:hypothetical protein
MGLAAQIQSLTNQITEAGATLKIGAEIDNEALV